MNYMSEEDAFAMLDGVQVLDDDVLGNSSYKLTAKSEYHKLKRFGNVTTYSQLLDLHACPRKFHLMKHYAGKMDTFEDNIDFAFGHSVGAGVQSIFIRPHLDFALFQSFLAWNASFDGFTKKKKSIWEAGIAVEKFWIIYNQSLKDEWEIVTLANGKPGIELAFSLDTNNGYKHYGHIDAVLRNISTGEIAVIELKTTGMKNAEEAVYANSSQALGYSVILDSIFPGISSYEVFHFIYSSTDREWTPMPFTKTVSHKAEWIKDLLLDHATIDKYHELKFFPKRGESCYNYFRRCEFFGTCNVVPATELPRLEMEASAEIVDYALNLEDIIKAQQSRLL